MKTAFLFLVIVLVAGAAGLAVAYWRYRTSPAGRWKRDVRDLIANFQSRQAELRRTAAGVEAEFVRLADDAFVRYLRTIPITRLDEYPNVGGKIISRLQEAGFRHLADAKNARFEGLPDIGPARGSLLRSAVEAQLKDARSRFDAGGCPEAQEYRQQVDALRAVEQDQGARRSAELVGIATALKEAFDLLPLAHTVTFVRFLLRQPTPGLTPALLSRPLPTAGVAHPPPRPLAPAVAAPAVLSTAVVMAAEPISAPFSLPPSPPAPPVPPTPADLFRAALGEPTKPTGAAQAEHPGLARMRAVIGLGFVVARADGRVAQSERKVIRAQLDQLFGHDPVLIRNIDPLMERIEKAAPNETTVLADVRAAFLATELPAIYQWAERIADASGERNQKERDALGRIAAALAVDVKPPTGPSPETQPAQGPAPPTPPAPAAASVPPPDYRALLDIAPDVTLDPDLIRRRYQLLTDKLDPARAAALGPEFAHMAEAKRKQTRAAAEALIAPFNEPLEKPAPPPPTDLRHNPDLDDVFGA